MDMTVFSKHAGASEIIGTDLVVKSNPDGYTMVLVSLRFSVNPSLVKMPYDPVRDLDPVSMTAAVGNVLVVNAKSPVKSVKELIALARQKPGEFTFASSGIGGPAIADLLGGNVSMSFASMTSLIPFIKTERLRLLAVSSRERSSQLPEVPTMIEASMPNLDVRDWQGLLVPRGTPRPVIDKLATEIRRILNQPDSKARYAAQGMDIIASTPDEFRKSIASEIQRWAKVVKDANIKAQ